MAAVLATLALGPPMAARAADPPPDPGATRALACAGCHGADGLSVRPDAPNLAGQPAIYLAAQLRAYRAGVRRHEVMSLVARDLSDEDIARLAAWFAAIHVEATPPAR